MSTPIYETVVCERCGTKAFLWYSVRKVNLCPDCYEQFINVFQDFLDEGG